MKHIAVVGLGSNIPDEAPQIIERLKDALTSLGSMVAHSDTYTTKPWGKTDATLPVYHNAVVVLETEMNLETLMSATKNIENKMGRREDSPRVEADIDIVIWDNQALRPHEIERDYFRIGYNQIKRHV